MSDTAVYAAGAVVWRVIDGKPLILVIHRTAYADVTLPKGKVDPGETLAETAVREVYEETGYHAEVGELLGIDSRVIPASSRLEPGAAEPMHALRIIYRARVTGGTLRNEVDGSTDEAAWFRPEEVGELRQVKLVEVGRGMAGLR